MDQTVQAILARANQVPQAFQNSLPSNTQQTQSQTQPQNQNQNRNQQSNSNFPAQDQSVQAILARASQVP